MVWAIIILIYLSIFPLVWFFVPQTKLMKDFEYVGVVIYWLAFNVLFVLGVGYIVVGCIAYPYSNTLFSKTYKRSTNERFGVEFIRCCYRVQRLINDMME